MVNAYRVPTERSDFEMRTAVSVDLIVADFSKNDKSRLPRTKRRRPALNSLSVSLFTSCSGPDTAAFAAVCNSRNAEFFQSFLL
jgi:hypothetical protein